MTLLATAFVQFPGANALDEAIRNASRTYNVEVNLGRAIAFQESRFNPGTPNGAAGEVGPFQVMPSTADWLQGRPSSPPEVKGADINSIEGNAILGIFYLKLQLDTFKDKWKAVAAYNAGPGRVGRLIRQHGEGYFSHLPSSTQSYVKSVQSFYKQLNQEEGGGALNLSLITSLIKQVSLVLGIPQWIVALFFALLAAGFLFLAVMRG